MLNRVITWASAAWPKNDFAAQRASFTAYVTLRQDAQGMTAILGNAGQAPVLRWTVNGKTVAGSGALLSPGSFVKGDTVLVELTSTAACLTPARSVARATRVAQ